MSTEHSGVETSTEDGVLRATAVVFLIALLVHGADHLRRGLGILTPEVLWAGSLQLATAAVVLVLVFRRHRLAPLLAIAIGLPSALGFTAAHLLPHWSAFSDSFTGSDVAPRVTAFSWFAAIFEITADLAFALAGAYALRRSARPTLLRT
jgi:hypothetical protein